MGVFIWNLFFYRISQQFVTDFDREVPAGAKLSHPRKFSLAGLRSFDFAMSVRLAYIMLISQTSLLTRWPFSVFSPSQRHAVIFGTLTLEVEG